jgi:hypothetical protein
VLLPLVLVSLLLLALLLLGPSSACPLKRLASGRAAWYTCERHAHVWIFMGAWVLPKVSQLCVISPVAQQDAIENM